MDKHTPAQCPKSASPYNHCPFVFKHEDDMILSYVSSLACEIKRINGLGNTINANDARMIDRYACEITAYLNGRIHQIVFNKPNN